jgi:UDP-N-acetylglucosamine 2-epimerase (non-hydrolysing)
MELPGADATRGFGGAATPRREAARARTYHRCQVPGVRTVVSIVGARPNFMKIAPVIGELNRRRDEFVSILVHTGQHYDDAMSRVFFEELGVAAPHHELGVGSGSHAQQTARVLERLEPVLLETRPDIVLVPGDVNSTLGASLAAAKLHIPIGHIEAGLRSFDRSMPEEINRVVADALSDLLFVHSPEAINNLVSEGIAREKIHMVGNTMIDSLVAMRRLIDSLDVPQSFGLERDAYLVVTLHRPPLVDGPLLAEAMDALEEVGHELPVVFPVHPRTRAALNALGLQRRAGSRLHLLEPQGYVEFLSLVEGAAGVITDSGGLQEETTYLGIPCFTLRANTERPITCEIGTNTVLGLAPERIKDVPNLLCDVRSRPVRVPEYWDGSAAVRIIEVLSATLT